MLMDRECSAPAALNAVLVRGQARARALCRMWDTGGDIKLTSKRVLGPMPAAGVSMVIEATRP